VTNRKDVSAAGGALGFVPTTAADREAARIRNGVPCRLEGRILSHHGTVWLRHGVRVGLILIAGSTVNCARPDSPALDPAGERAIADTIQTLTEAYNDAWETLDIEAIMDFHGAGFEYYWFDIKAEGDFGAILGDWLSETVEFTWQVSEPSVEVLGGDAAVISFLFKDRVVFRSGSVAETRGAMSYVFEQRDDNWEIVRVHQSGPPPPGLDTGGG
jgi:ketosteroid isomerase-like protein